MMMMTRTRRLSLLALLLTGCPADPAVPGAVDTDTAALSTGVDLPTGPTGTGTQGTTEAATSGQASTSASNSDSGDATTGAVEVCGDGVVGPGEGCDDGPNNGPDVACTAACQPNVCGDGDVYAGVEGCDEGAGNVDSGYCRSSCQLGVCGDGFVFALLEECDAGGANGPVYGQCDGNCTINRCGDGELDVGFEDCDEGEHNGGAGERGMAGCDLECGFSGLRVFLSSQGFTGDMGTRAGADLACQNMAKGAGCKRAEDFRALLADAEGGPNSFIAVDPQDRPFILPSGLVIAASYPELISAGPGAGITTTELGEVVFDKLVWTNVNPFGDAYLKDPASTCAGWTSADGLRSARVGYNAVSPGNPAALAEWTAKKQWLSFSTESCDGSYRIYCIEAG